MTGRCLGSCCELGGIANQQGKDWLRGLSNFQPGDFHVPLLHLYQPGDEVVVPDFELVRSLRGADRWLVRVEGLRHFDFTSLGAAAGIAPELAPPERVPAIVKGWASTVYLTRRFLDASVRDEAGGLEDLKASPEPPKASAVPGSRQTLPIRASRTCDRHSYTP
ncbi:MAG: hypothetical protein ACJ8AT_21460 [Hyalangium sp.]|uniref:hypothetical protein n=1 Tax=Hyalangium sp. TaxID=2028555 RepID=UPI00389AEC38